MNRLNSRRLIVVSAVLLVVTATVLISFRGVVRELIVIPLSYWYWIISLFLESTPQIFFWVLAVLIVAIIAWRSFFKKQKRIEVAVKVPDYSPATGRVTYWANRVNLMQMGSYYQSTFNEALSRLALDLISYRYRLTNRQIERGLQRNTIIVPTQVRDFLLKHLFQREFSSVNFTNYVYRTIRLWWITHIFPSRQRREQITPDARRLIQYMEEELEVKYGNVDR